MAEVSVDGEEVIFEGDPPSEIGQVFELLMKAMSERGRAVVSFQVDGQDLLAMPEGESAPETFSKIEAFTLTHSELTLKLIETAEQETEPLGEELFAYARKLLLLGWSEIFQRMDEFIGKIKPVADLLDNLGPFAETYDPSWKPPFQNLQKRQADALEEVLLSFQTGNPARLSDAVENLLHPILMDFLKLSKSEIKPYLREQMEQVA